MVVDALVGILVADVMEEVMTVSEGIHEGAAGGGGCIGENPVG